MRLSLLLSLVPAAAGVGSDAAANAAADGAAAGDSLDAAWDEGGAAVAVLDAIAPGTDTPHFSDEDPIALGTYALGSRPSHTEGASSPLQRQLYYSCYGESNGNLCGWTSCGCGKGCSYTCARSCTVCECDYGTYSSPYGKVTSGTACSDCPSGQYQDSYGQTSCKECSAVSQRIH